MAGAVPDYRPRQGLGNGRQTGSNNANVFRGRCWAEWYVHLPQDIKTNYGRLTDAFLEEFRPKPAQRWEAENALRARSQKPGEDLRSFIRVVRREGNRIGLTDDQLVPIVMNNLLPNVRALIPGTPATLTAILDTPVGRGDVQVASTGGIDHSQYQQLFDM